MIKRWLLQIGEWWCDVKGYHVKVRWYEDTQKSITHPDGFTQTRGICRMCNTIVFDSK